MATTIYKYSIPQTDYFIISLPKGAQILSVQTQNDAPQLWALVDPDAPKEERRFRLFATGQPIDEPGSYIGTFQVMGGRLVFHLFEIMTIVIGQ